MSSGNEAGKFSDAVDLLWRTLNSEREMTCFGPTPAHLAIYGWYAPHQAWLRDQGLNHHDPGEARPVRADLRGASFEGARLVGASLDGARLVGASLDRARLEGVSLNGASLDGASLVGASLDGARLVGASLDRARLDGTRLDGARLDGASLDGVHARSPVPHVPDLDAEILRAIETGGSLDMSAWHTCDTTHCRAGWAVHLAGGAGYDLERELGPTGAGALIYWRSAGYVPDFYAHNENALADIRERADREFRS